MRKRKRNGDHFVGGLAHGLAVIECFDEKNPQLSLSEVARRSGLTPATARRSLNTLVSLGYMRNVEKRYLLSARILALGSAYLKAAHVEDAFFPELRHILSLFGDTSSVAILSGREVLWVAQASSQRALRPVAAVGATSPAYAAATGRALLSGLSDAELDYYLRTTRLEKVTDSTEADPKKLKKIIQEVRRNGYALSVDQLMYGMTSLAVPIKLESGSVVAAISSAGYTGKLTPEAIVRERFAELQAAARRIGAALDKNFALAHSLATGLPRALSTAPAVPQREAATRRNSLRRSRP